MMVNSGSLDGEAESMKAHLESAPLSGSSPRPCDMTDCIPEPRDDGLITELEGALPSSTTEITSLPCSVPLDKIKNVLDICLQESRPQDFKVLQDYLRKNVNTISDKEKMAGNKRLLCLYCDRTFSTQSLKQKHVDRCHSVGQVRRSSSRTASHNQAASACCFCNKPNSTERTLIQLLEHLINEHSNRYFACLSCQERFVTGQNLTDHNKTVHGIVPDKSPSPVQPSSPNAYKTITDGIPNTLEDFEETIKANIITPNMGGEPKQEVEEDLKVNVKAAKKMKKISVKSMKNGVKSNIRTTRSSIKQAVPKKKKARSESPKEPEKKNINSSTSVFSLVNAYIYKHEKIYDHSSDSIRDSNSIKFDAIFDKDFYNRTVRNIEENLSHFLDGKLNRNLESETRISQFEQNDKKTIKCDDFGSDISLNAVTPVAPLLTSSQYEGIDSQIEYGAKASQKKCKNISPMKYKYTNKKLNSASKNLEHSDMTSLDMWTQLVIKQRQEKPNGSLDTAKQVEDLNRILDTRGPFDDLRLEAQNLSKSKKKDVEFILEDILQNAFDRIDAKPATLTPQPNQNLDMAAYLGLLPSCPQTLDTKNVELTGEWTRPRIYICATCGFKLPNLKALDDHKNVSHPNIWGAHYEFVGSQSKNYQHLSIPGLGKVGYVETLPLNRIWQKSDARTCTKCAKHCHNLGELHRHMLECGGDWTWMLARKKCKYRPYGARSRRRRQRGYKRTINPLLRAPKEYKPKIKPAQNGPRPKPSDAETIERMLANLPPKRHRKMISMRDGIQRPRKPYNYKNQQTPVNTQENVKKLNRVMYKTQVTLSNQNLKNALKRKLEAKSLKNRNTEELKPEEDKVEKPLAIAKKKLTRVLSSKLFDTNTNIMSRRRLVQAITQNNFVRRTRLRAKNLELEKTTENSEQSDIKELRKKETKKKLRFNKTDEPETEIKSTKKRLISAFTKNNKKLKNLPEDMEESAKRKTPKGRKTRGSSNKETPSVKTKLKADEITDDETSSEETASKPEKSNTIVKAIRKKTTKLIQNLKSLKNHIKDKDPADKEKGVALKLMRSLSIRGSKKQKINLNDKGVKKTREKKLLDDLETMPTLEKFGPLPEDTPVTNSESIPILSPVYTVQAASANPVAETPACQTDAQDKTDQEPKVSNETSNSRFMKTCEKNTAAINAKIVETLEILREKSAKSVHSSLRKRKSIDKNMKMLESDETLQETKSAENSYASESQICDSNPIPQQSLEDMPKLVEPVTNATWNPSEDIENPENVPNSPTLPFELSQQNIPKNIIIQPAHPNETDVISPKNSKAPNSNSPPIDIHPSQMPNPFKNDISLKSMLKPEIVEENLKTLHRNLTLEKAHQSYQLTDQVSISLQNKPAREIAKNRNSSCKPLYNSPPIITIENSVLQPEPNGLSKVSCPNFILKPAHLNSELVLESLQTTKNVLNSLTVEPDIANTVLDLSPRSYDAKHDTLVNKETENKQYDSENDSKPSTSALNKLKSKIKKPGKGLNDCIAMLKCKLEQKTQIPESPLVDKSNLFILNSAEVNNHSPQEDKPESEKLEEMSPETPLDILPDEESEDSANVQTEMNEQINLVINEAMKNSLLECVKNKCEELKSVSSNPRKIGSIRRRQKRTEQSLKTPETHDSEDDIPLRNFLSENKLKIKIPKSKKKRRTKKISFSPHILNSEANFVQETNLDKRIEQLDNSLNERITKIQEDIKDSQIKCNTVESEFSEPTETNENDSSPSDISSKPETTESISTLVNSITHNFAHMEDEPDIYLLDKTLIDSNLNTAVLKQNVPEAVNFSPKHKNADKENTTDLAIKSKRKNIKKIKMKQICKIKIKKVIPSDSTVHSKEKLYIENIEPEKTDCEILAKSDSEDELPLAFLIRKSSSSTSVNPDPEEHIHTVDSKNEEFNRPDVSQALPIEINSDENIIPSPIEAESTEQEESTETEPAEQEESIADSSNIKISEPLTESNSNDSISQESLVMDDVSTFESAPENVLVSEETLPLCTENLAAEEDISVLEETCPKLSLDITEKSHANSEFITTPDLANASIVIKIKKNFKFKRGKKNRKRVTCTRTIVKPKKQVELTEVLCDICNKTFRRSENLAKHKRTLTHIAKLSALEAKESMARKNSEDKENYLETVKKIEENQLDALEPLQVLFNPENFDVNKDKIDEIANESKDETNANKDEANETTNADEDDKNIQSILDMNVFNDDIPETCVTPSPHYDDESPETIIQDMELTEHENKNDEIINVDNNINQEDESQDVLIVEDNIVEFDKNSRYSPEINVDGDDSDDVQIVEVEENNKLGDALDGSESRDVQIIDDDTMDFEIRIPEENPDKDIHIIDDDTLDKIDNKEAENTTYEHVEDVDKTNFSGKSFDDSSSDIDNTLSPKSMSCEVQNLKLVDIINDVLDKPVKEMKNDEYFPIISSQNSSSDNYSEPRRYKSLGERKSFDSDSFILPQKCLDDMLSNESYTPKSVNDGMLSKQLTLLENIIETKNNLNYIDDSISLSSNQFEESSEQTEKDYAPAESIKESQIKFSHTADLISTYIKPDFTNFESKTNQYDDISQPNFDEEKSYKENPTRKILNRDEELFLECCSLLKSGSEVSNKKHIQNYNQNHDWLERKQSEISDRYIQRESYGWLAQVPRTDTPISESFNNDWLDSNSAVSSEWLRQKPSPDRPVETKTINDKSNNNLRIKYSDIQFEDISVDSSATNNTLIVQNIKSTEDIPLNFHNVDFSKNELIKTDKDCEIVEPPKYVQDTKRELSNEMDKVESRDIVKEITEEKKVQKEESCQVDNDLKKKVVTAFGGLMARALNSRLQAVVRRSNKIREKRALNSIQSSITDFTIPIKRNKINSPIDMDSNDIPKKLMTKGAMKIFEGLKVSIPMQDLNLKEVLSCSLKKKLGSSFCEEKTGNKLGMKETKKKLKMEMKCIDKKDVYDFEESQDGSVKNNSLPVFRKFRDTPDNTENFDDTLPVKIPEVPAKEPDAVRESDSETDRYYDSMSFEENSVSNLSLQQGKGQPKSKVKKDNQKKCMIMGRIFKNASKPKLEDKIPEIRDFSFEENSKLAENYIESCSSVENVETIEYEQYPNVNNVTVLNSANKMSKKEMDLLFDKLLEGETEKIVEPKTDETSSPPPPPVKIVIDKTKKPEKKQKCPKIKKRQRHNSEESRSSDEFRLPGRTTKSKKCHRTPRKSKKDGGINLEQEIKECIGVAGRKSQRKCTSGKQNVLAEFWSSDESSFEELIKTLEGPEEKQVEPIEPFPETENIAVPIVENNETEDVEHSDVYSFESDVDGKNVSVSPAVKIKVKKPMKPKIKMKKKEELSIEMQKVNKAEHRKKSIDTEHKKKLNEDSGEEFKNKIYDASTESLANSRRKRNAANMLYYWSSSSEDELMDMIEVKPLREDIDDDRPMQHGWIVGDSPKKLVTMLAQAKGKKIECESVKEQHRKNRNSL